MIPVSHCEPELLSLHSAALCQEDLAVCIYACSRASAPELLLLEWEVKEQGLHTYFMKIVM